MREFTIAILVGLAIYSAVIFSSLAKRLKKNKNWESENLDLDNLTTAIIWLAFIAIIWVPILYLMQMVDPLLK